MAEQSHKSMVEKKDNDLIGDPPILMLLFFLAFLFCCFLICFHQLVHFFIKPLPRYHNVYIYIV